MAMVNLCAPFISDCVVQDEYGMPREAFAATFINRRRGRVHFRQDL